MCTHNLNCVLNHWDFFHVCLVLVLLSSTMKNASWVPTVLKKYRLILYILASTWSRSIGSHDIPTADCSRAVKEMCWLWICMVALRQPPVGGYHPHLRVGVLILWWGNVRTRCQLCWRNKCGKGQLCADHWLPAVVHPALCRSWECHQRAQVPPPWPQPAALSQQR